MKAMQLFLVLVFALFNVWGSDPTVLVSNSGLDQNIMVQIPNQFLGQFTVITTGEPVSVSEMTFSVDTLEPITNIQLFDKDGTVLAGPVDSIISGSSSIIWFTDTVVFPTGVYTYVIKGRVLGSFPNGDTLFLSTTPAVDWKGARSLVTGESVSISPNSLVQGPRVKVYGGYSRVSFSLTLDKVFSDECSCEELLLNVEGVTQGFKYEVWETTGSLVSPISWAKCAEFVAENTNQSVILPMTSDSKFFRLVQMGFVGIAVATEPSSPTFRVVAGGDVGVLVTVAKLRAIYDNVRLLELNLALSSGSPADVMLATVWNGSVQIGCAQFIGTNRLATVTLSQSLILSKDEDKSLLIKVDLSPIGIAQPVVESGHHIMVDVVSAEGVMMSSGNNTFSSGRTQSEGVRVFKSYPTFAIDPLPSTGLADGRLLRFKVTANTAGPVSLSGIWVDFVSDGIYVMDEDWYGFTDSNYSSPVAGAYYDGVLASTVGRRGLYVYLDGNPGAVVIPAGQTMYFEIQGMLFSSNFEYHLLTSVVGDESFWGNARIDGPRGLLGQNVLWSPNSSGISRLEDPDWFNGFGIPGLPSTGIFQLRSN